MQDIKIVFYTEQELEAFIDALEGLRDTDSDGFTQQLLGKRVEVSMCTTPECYRENLIVPDGMTQEQYLDSINTITVSVQD